MYYLNTMNIIEFKNVKETIEYIQDFLNIQLTKLDYDFNGKKIVHFNTTLTQDELLKISYVF